MKRVLQIIGRLNIGGPAIHIVLLTQQLDPGRYAPLLITGVESPTEGNMLYLAQERGVQPIILPEMGREISFRDDLIALLKLIALMRREKPDIIHTHTAKAGTLGRAAALLALPGRRKRLYHTFHGHVFSGYFGPRKTRMFLRIERFLGRYTDRLIAVSERTRDDLIAYRIAPAEKIAVVPLGLELDPFLEGARFRGELRRELCLPPDALLIGLVARLVPIKAIPDFLEAAAIVAERVPNAVFVIVGDGEMRQELEAQARALGLGARARFLGFRKDLPRLYADLDMVVLSSRNEGLPTSLIEAMASGCVVVSTAVGGVPDLIQEGETGYLAPPAEPGALAAAIQRALAERERWPQITQCAQESARERFHLQRLMAEIEALYEN